MRPGVCGLAAEEAGVGAVLGQEVALELGADLVGGLADAGPDGGVHPLAPATKRFHGGKGGFDHPAEGPAPAGMGGGDHAGFRVGEQHGRAVGRQHGRRPGRGWP